jgi:hypothetical protein
LLRYGLLDQGFPTRILRERAVDAVGAAALQWVVEHDILVPRSAEEYGLVDEFLRVRLALDAETEAHRPVVEEELIEEGLLLSWEEIQEHDAEQEERDGS